MRTDTETRFFAGVNAFFIYWTRIGGGAILITNNTVIIFSEKVSRATAGSTIEADQVSWTLICNSALMYYRAKFEWISIKSGWTDT